MKRKGLIALFMLFFALLLGRVGGGSTLYAQAKLYDVAVELMKNYPKEWDGFNEGCLAFEVVVPLNRVRPSLIDSIEVAFASETAKADYTSVVRKQDVGRPYLSYVVGWEYNGDFNTNRLGHEFPYMGSYGVFDTLDDTMRVQMFINHISTYAPMKSDSKPRLTDIKGVDELFDRLLQTYPAKKRKVEFVEGNRVDNAAGYDYTIDCNADSVYAEIYKYMIWHFCEHFTDHAYFIHSPKEYGGRIKIRYQEGGTRRIEILVYQDKLRWLDIRGTLASETPFNWPERMKRKNIFSSTYIYPTKWVETQMFPSGEKIRVKGYDYGIK